MLAFGRTDYSGQFQPIAVAIFKREREDDYVWFLNALKSMCAQHLNINLDERVKYIMMDACDAEYNACKKVFPRVHILMKNVKDHFKSDSVPAELEKMVKNDIEELHTCLSFDQFSYKLNNVHLKWSTYPSLNKFRDYFFKEWCYHNNEWSRLSCCQLFQTPAGVATTNNPIESFNKTIKSVYTIYEIATVYSFLLTIMQKLINQYSYQPLFLSSKNLNFFSFNNN